MSLASFFRNLFKKKKKERIYHEDTSAFDLDDEQIAANREAIVELLKSTRRKGMNHVIEYLDKNGFFIVPSSVHHHHNWRGGLAQHSLAVYNKAVEKDVEVSPESLIIVCLLHDICKADRLCYDSNGQLCRTEEKSRGRGRRSIQILKRCGLDITDQERRAIRWHMGGYNAHSDESAEVNKTRRDELWKVLYYTNKEDATA